MSININTKTVENTIIVELSGDIDAKIAPLVQQQVLPLVKPAGKLILDLSQVVYLSSAGLRFLMSIYRKMLAQEGKLVLVGLVEEVRDTMSVTGFLDFFTTCETLQSGLDTLQ